MTLTGVTSAVGTGEIHRRLAGRAGGARSWIVNNFFSRFFNILCNVFTLLLQLKNILGKCSSGKLVLTHLPLKRSPTGQAGGEQALLSAEQEASVNQ